MFGADDDDDEWDGQGGLDVGLDYGSEFPPAMPAAPSAAPEAPRGSGLDLADDPGPPPSLRRPPAPKPAAVADHGPRFSPAEIEAVARYGLVPTNPLAAPLYTWRVFRRRRELVDLLALQKRTHEQATTTLRSKLADITDEVIGRAAEPAQVAGVLGPIRAAEQKIADRKVQLEAASGQFASQFRSIQMDLDAEAKRRQQLDRDRNMAQIKVEDAVHKRAHVAAELKRVNIEIETAHESAAKAAGAGANFAPPEHAKRITTLEAQRAKLAEQVKARDGLVADARAELKERQRAISQLESRVSALHASQSNMEQQASQAQSLGLDSLKQAQNERLVAYEVAIESIAAQLPQLVDDTITAQIADVKRQIASCDADLAKQEFALDAYDAGAYKRGIAIVIAAGVLLLLGLISVARVQ